MSKVNFYNNLNMANEEYRELYCIYKEIIEVVNVLEVQSRKRLKKLSDVDDGLDNNKPIDGKINKQTKKFAKAILEFNAKVNGLLVQFKNRSNKTFKYFRQLQDSCKGTENELECLKEVNRKLKFMNLIIQKFLNKIVRLQSASNIFPNLSNELTLAKVEYEENLKKTVISLRSAIIEIKEIMDGINKMDSINPKK